MNHLMRELAPVSDVAWRQIEEEAERSLKHVLAARRLVDFTGPLGWTHSSVDLGRVKDVNAGNLAPAEVAQRQVLAILELRVPFSMARSELAAADRGATDLDLDPVIEASRSAALAEDGVVFAGFEPAGIAGMGTASPHEPVSIGDDYGRYPEHVAAAVAALRGADIAGPYAIALGDRCFKGVTETTEHGGYPVFEHVREILGGPIVWAPAVDGAIVMSRRGGDYELTIGEDFALGYSASDAGSVSLYIEETLAFRVITPEAAVRLAYS